MSVLPLTGAGPSVGGSYAAKVLATQPGNLIAYWPLWETTGAVADNLEGTAARDGDYVGVTLGQPGIGDGRTCPFFDDLNDYVDVYSASLASAFDGAEGTLMVWVKMFDVNVWADAAYRMAVQLATLNAGEYARFLLRAEGSYIDMQYKIGGVENFARYTSARTDFFHMAMTWSKSAGSTGELKGYIDGVQQGATVTNLGVWGGALDTGFTLIGALNKGPSTVWYGWIAHCAVWNTPLSLAQITPLATV